MTHTHHRLAKEKKTIVEMVKLYCHSHHNTTDEHLCQNCDELLRYALERLDKCPFGVEKGPCSKCEIHCYKPSMRNLIRNVMQYSGPKMLFRHPILAVSHLLNKWNKRGIDKKANSKVEMDT